MSAFVRRFLNTPSLEVLNSIEAVNVVDLAPPSPTVGVGSGTLLAVGEYEDGPFAAGGDSPFFAGDKGVQQIFSSEDMVQRFGGFGYTYGQTPHNNPCARRHLSEFWNGNGYIKLKYCRPRRLLLSRVDTSVGEVSFQPLATIAGGRGTFQLAPALQLAITTSSGGPASSTAINAVAAQVTGVAGTYPTLFVGGETMSIQIDGGPVIAVGFTAGDQALANVISRINTVVGLPIASNSGGQLRLTGQILGTAGQIVVANVSGTPLTTFGITPGTTAGTGNVANSVAVTAAEVATIINNTVALTAINVAASVGADGTLRISCTTGGTGTILIAAGAMATALGLDPVGLTVTASLSPGGLIPAGTRVRTAGGAEWVTMQTLTIPEGTTSAPITGPFPVKVRPATDDGTAIGTAVTTVTVVVDQPSFANLSVSNITAIGPAKTEPQMDVAYEAAFDASLSISDVTREVNFSISARRSPAVVRKGLDNAVFASDNGSFGRKFITRAPLGFSIPQALADVGLLRSDRLFYAYPGWKVRIPEIATRGTAGGIGFTADGIITVGADAPLATLCCRLNPEENPGQQTNLIDDFFAVEDVGTTLGITAYEQFKANGIAAPRVDQTSGSIYQSGVTSSLTSGRKTMARRKMADFIQDSLATSLVPYSKKLAIDARLAGISSQIDAFLNGLLSPSNPELQRIGAYSVDPTSGNTPEQQALGIYTWVVNVRTLSSLDAIVLQTNIGENVVTVAEI